MDNLIFTQNQLIHIGKIKDAADLLLKDCGFHEVVGIKTNVTNIVVAGGMFASLIYGDDPNDYDIYVLNSDWKTFDKLRAALVPNAIAQSSNEYNRTNKHIISVVGGRKHEINMHGHQYKCQIVLTDYMSRHALLDDFDFIHSRVSMTYNSSTRMDPTLYITKRCYYSIMTKTLIENPNKPPSCNRIEKFRKRGWILMPKIKEELCLDMKTYDNI